MAAFNYGTPVLLFAKHTVLLLLVATLSHSAFCVWNDICDRELDARVGKYSLKCFYPIILMVSPARTCNRPLVTGVVSISDATVLFAILVVSTLVAVSFTNKDS